MDDKTKLHDSSIPGLLFQSDTPSFNFFFSANYEDNINDAQVKRREHEAIGEPDQGADTVHAGIQGDHPAAYETVQVSANLVLVTCLQKQA